MANGSCIDPRRRRPELSPRIPSLTSRLGSTFIANYSSVSRTCSRSSSSAKLRVVVDGTTTTAPAAAATIVVNGGKPAPPTFRPRAPPESYQKEFGGGTLEPLSTAREGQERSGSRRVPWLSWALLFLPAALAPMRRSDEYMPAGRDDTDDRDGSYDDEEEDGGGGSSSAESKGSSRSSGDNDSHGSRDRLRNQIIVVRYETGGNRAANGGSGDDRDAGVDRRIEGRDRDGDDGDGDDDEEAVGYSLQPPPMSPSRRLWRLASSSLMGPQHDDYEAPGDAPASTAPSPSHLLRAAAVTGLVLAFMTAALLWNRSYRLMSSSPSGSADDPTGEKGESCFREDELARRFYAQTTLADIPNGAVASDHAYCSQMGMEVLSEKGGNAVDAAVTVALCLGVANPGSSGLGGGAFMLIHSDPSDSSRANLDGLRFDDFRDPSIHLPSGNGKVTTVVDCREVAPGAATTTMFDSQQTPLASLIGGLAVAVPGELRGLELAHRMHGTLPWRDVVEPVSRLATKGVEVNENLAHEIAYMASNLNSPEVVDFGLRSLLTRGDSWDNPLREKELLQNQRLGELLQSVADKGADALYVEMAEALADDIQAAGGVVTAHDIRNYRATLRSPLFSSDVDGFTVVGIPPPSSGGAAVIGAARFLSGVPFPFATFADTLSVHLLSEALKHVYAIRMSLSDPAYNNDTVKDAVYDMTRGSYIEMLRNATLENGTLPLSQYGGRKWAQLKDSDGSTNASDAQEGDRRLRRRKLLRPLGYLNDAGTSHFSIIDKDGNAVAMTTSVNTYFGSTVVSKSTGIVLGNTMDDFSSPGTSNYFGIRPSEANFIVPGKKPLSSMSPTMVFRNTNKDASLGDLILVIGASGGPKIISAVLQVLALSLLQGSSLFESVVHPRIHDQLLYHGSAVTAVEDSVLADGTPLVVSQRTQDALRRRYHNLVNVDYMGTVQAIAVDPETSLLTATCDVRKGGSPAGY